jgi:hypothetical protein
LDLGGFDRMISVNKRPVAIVINHVRRKRNMDGRKPALAVSTGSPNIPAPIEVPVTMDTAVINFRSKVLLKIVFSMRENIDFSRIF